MAYKTKLNDILENITDMNERDMEADLAHGLSDDFSEANTAAMPSLTEMRAAVPKTEESAPAATFKHYAETVTNLKKGLRMAMYQRSKRGQDNLTDVQAEALDRIIEDVANLLTYDASDVRVWNSVINNADLGKG